MPDSAKPSRGCPSRPAHKTHNVESETKDPDSVLNFYRQLLALRHKEPTLLEGDYFPLNEDDPNVFAYLRRYKGEAIMVVLNMSASPQKANFYLGPAGFTAPKISILLNNAHAPVVGTPEGLSLPPFSAMLAKIAQ